MAFFHKINTKEIMILMYVNVRSKVRYREIM
jgi:hypothetical protein